MSTHTVNKDKAATYTTDPNAEQLGLILDTFPKDVWFDQKLVGFQAGLPKSMVEELLPIFVHAGVVEYHPKNPDKLRVNSSEGKDKVPDGDLNPKSSLTHALLKTLFGKYRRVMEVE